MRVRPLQLPTAEPGLLKSRSPGVLCILPSKDELHELARRMPDTLSAERPSHVDRPTETGAILGFLRCWPNRSQTAVSSRRLSHHVGTSWKCVGCSSRSWRNCRHICDFHGNHVRRCRTYRPSCATRRGISRSDDRRWLASTCYRLHRMGYASALGGRNYGCRGNCPIARLGL
jgi:hypothetical protein